MGRTIHNAIRKLWETRFLKTAAPLLMIPVLLAGCSARSKTPEQVGQETGQRLAAGYEATLQIKSGDVKAQAMLSQPGPGDMTLRFLEPASMEGLTFVMEGDRMTVGYKGISKSFTMAELLDSTAAKQIAAVVDRAVSGEGLSLDLTEEALIMSGPASSGQFTLTVDREGGRLLRLSIPEEELEVEFSSFEFAQ